MLCWGFIGTNCHKCKHKKIEKGACVLTKHNVRLKLFSYDKVMERKNFKIYSHGRADILADIVQKRMQGINYADGI